MKSKNKIMKSKRVIAFSMAAIMSGMALFPSITGAIKSFAAPKEEIAADDSARLYVNNTPIRLEVSKIKTQVGGHEGIAPKSSSAEKSNTITYKYSGRKDGSESALIQTYGSSNIELAYSSNGTYLGYGWKRGTLEYLNYREKNQGTFDDLSVDIIYNESGVFTGYAYITKKLETADDINRYVAGATMVLYDAIEIKQYDDYTMDDKFEGVTVQRNSDSDVTSTYVNKGHAGTKIEYVKEKIDENYNYQDEINDAGEAVWIAKTIQREDTPILYYSLSDLQITSNDTYYTNASANEKEIDKVFGSERPDKKNRLYGFDQYGDVIDITQKDQTDFPIYGFEKGNTKPTFEIYGGSYEHIEYDAVSKKIKADTDTKIYHLDRDGNRDSQVDPQTGIAYIEQKNGNTTKTYVWPVNIFKDGTGSETFEKIITNRIATMNADSADEYTVGTFTGNGFVKSVNPTMSEHGLPIYYQKSILTYVKGADKFDRDGDYLGYGYFDKLDNDNLNAYIVKDHDNLYNGDKDNPFDQSTHYQYSTSQKIVVTVDIDGNYIVDGASTVPKPSRDGFVFGGWLVQPNDLDHGMMVNARWLNTGSMTNDQKNKWYSEKAAEGTTKKITVIFHANGGTFTDGSGDIHSSDNKLYYRQGEAFLIDNTWVTGEATPNDPFDALSVNTSQQTADTANDPYSNTKNGGFADTIKRITPGTYIMEETVSPEGYTKALPVGITVVQSDQVKRAEMIDTTIKIQIVKVDSTDAYEYNLYENGTLMQNPDGTNIKYREQTGSFTYKNVPGAVLALKADSSIQRSFNDWIKATNHSQITKKQENGNWYITFTSDKPLYLEGIPKGSYTISEIVTPDGYVTAEDMTIVVNETTELITYVMNDDHTKLEVEKYYKDENGSQVMPNKYHAGLELQDKDGKVVSSWYTDDVTDYTSVVTLDSGFFKTLFGTARTSGFIENYEKLVHSGDTSFSTISWDVERTAEKKMETAEKELWYLSDGSEVVILNGNIPDDAPKGFKEAYTSRNMDSELNKFKYIITKSADKVQDDGLSTQMWRTDTNNMINICVYKSNAMTSEGRQGYLFEYKFNYRKDYTGIYQNMVSYDTIDGTHRFDYIPAGTYIIHEFDVPDGFVRADDKTIVVNESKDIQMFDLENVRKELIVAKVAMDDNGGLFAGTVNGGAVTGSIGVVIPGAKLALYKVAAFTEEHKNAFLNGTIPADAALIEEWTSGTDGAYTQKDEQKELIPAGYKVGDLKPHKVADIENGFYYLVEKTTPEYFRTAEPMEITVSDTTTASNVSKITVVNKEMTGKVIVKKINDAGSGLSGAVFLVKNKTTGTDVGTLVTKNGTGELVIHDIGYFDAAGMLIPYTFTIQETNPPAGYAVNSEIHEFTFDPNAHTGSAIAISVNDSSFHDGVLTVTDSVTVITVGKTDYQDGTGVGGAELQVLEAEFKNNIWASNGTTKDSWKWTTTAQTTSHPLEGLVAGKVYVLKELKAPSGYTVAPDMFFKVSDDGNRIDKIWYDKSENPYIKFNADNTGTIESLEMTTRKIAGSYVILMDTASGTEKNLGLLTDGLVLTSDEVTGGNIYKIKEIAAYSDHTESVIETKTFMADLKNGSMFLNTKYAKGILTTITDHNDSEILSFNPDGTVKKIDNSLVEETQGIFVSGNGKNHTAVNTESSNTSVITYSVKVDKAGTEVIWIPDTQTTVLRTEPKTTAENNVYIWTTAKDNETIKFTAILKDNAVGFINQKVSIDGNVYSYMNPIAFNYGEGLYKNTSKLSVYNEVQGTNPNNETYEFTYKVTLTKEDGSPLDGSYSYRTKNGTHHTFDAFGKDKTLELVLSGNDFTVISDLPYGTKYSVRVVDPSNDGFAVSSGITDSVTSKNSISNVLVTNTRNIASERELFKKNSTYTITEKTLLNDSSVLESAKYGFSIGENCEVISFDIKNKHTEIVIQKVDSEYNHLKGARLAIFDAANQQIEQWVSDGTEHVIKAKLEPGKPYLLKELSAASGHSYAKEIPFTVSSDGTVDMIIMVDHQTEVKVLKTDAQGNGLDGAKLQILDSSKKAVKARITDDTFEAGKDMIFQSKVTGTMISGQLDADTTYYLRELESPDGYYLAADDLKFVTNRDDTVTLISLANEKTKAVISKKEITGSDELPGATMVLKDKNGSVIDTWVSTTVPHEITAVLIAGETYTLHEEAAPDGYHYSVTITFKVPLKDEGIIKVEMIDEKTEIPFSKKDFTTDKELPGARIQIKDKDGTIIDDWISTENDHIIKGKLIAGETYYMHEESAPDGYYYAVDIEFTVPKNKDDVVKIEMKDTPTKIQLLKKDAVTGNSVVGAYIQIKDKNGRIAAEWVSDGKPHDITGKLIAGGTYYMHEVGAPGGYHSAEDIEFKVPLQNNGVIIVEMKDEPTNVEITKSDATTGTELPGARMELRDKNGDVIDEWISTSEPHKIVGKLIAGQKYYLYEEASPGGYYYSESVEFTIPLKNEGIVKVVMKDNITMIKISKIDGETGNIVVGAKLQLLDKNGVVLDAWETLEEYHEIGGKLIAGETYTLKETAPPSGYYYAEEVTFTVPFYMPIGGVINVIMKDNPIVTSFKKSDFTTGKELPGTHIQIKDKDGNIIDEWIYTEEEHIITGKFIVGETYYMHEEFAPDGYYYSEDIAFKIPQKGEAIFKVEMEDKPTKVNFKKTDITSEKELVGAVIQIKDESGRLIEEWISSETDHTIIGKLIVDKIYYMHEEKSPDGYGYSADIKFKVDKGNVVWVYDQKDKTWITAADSTVRMEDDVLKLEVMKVEAGTSTMIAGAKLQILDSTGRVCEEWNTVAGEKHRIVKAFSDGTLLKADELYTLVELSAPDGYIIAASQTFSPDRTGTLRTIVMEDSRVDKPWEPEINTITFDKYNGSYVEGSTTVTDGRKLAGAEYTIYRDNGTVYRVVTTGENGSVTIPRPEAGTYFLKETKAPDGYMLNKNIYSFTVSDSGNTDGILDIVNYKKPEIIISKKDSDSQTLIKGAEFKVLDSAGKVVFTGVTEITGQLTFTADYADTYTVIETKAPDGYELSTTYIKFTVAENGSVSGTTTIFNNKESIYKGTITANYSSKYNTEHKPGTPNGGFGIDIYGNIVLPKSGDEFHLAFIVFMWMGSFIMIGCMIFKKKRNKK